MDPRGEVPPIAVLGVAGPVLRTYELHPSFPVYNVNRLRTVIPMPFYPISLRGLTLLLAIYAPAVGEDWQLRFSRKNGEIWVTMKVSVNSFSATEAPVPAGTMDVAPQLAASPWHILGFHFPEEFEYVPGPDTIRISLLSGEKEMWVGGLSFVCYTPESLTSARIAALRSDPYSPKEATYGIACRSCGDGIETYVSLDGPSESRETKAIWYEHLPDKFCCSCGKTTIDLTTLRRGFQAVLAERFGADDSPLALTRLYEVSSLEVVCDNFRSLLLAEKGEPALHDFLRKNLVLFHFLSPLKIVDKAPILSKYRTDFVVLTVSGELLLVEIEDSSKRLLKKNGHPTASFTHAASQVHDWLHEFRSHRSACLECMQLDDREVAGVRGLVIMGRNAGHDAEQLRKLRASGYRDVSIYTFDDLLLSVVELTRAMKRTSRAEIRSGEASQLAVRSPQ